MRFIALALVLTAFAFGLFASPAAAQSSAGCRGFSGHWLTTWPGGTTKLHVVGTKGVFDYQGGILTGHIADGVFAGTYSEDNGSTGVFHFELGADGNSFKGWYAPSSDPSKHAHWNGICSGP